MHLNRNIKDRFLKSLTHRPVVLITGARQVGKSTFVKDIIRPEHKADYYTMDDITTWSAATSAPEDFLVSLTNNVILDEVQLAKELFRPLKALIDKNRKTIGKFILTGSTSVMMLPKLSDALVGRMNIHTLWPLSIGEKNNRFETFIDNLFSEDFKPKNNQTSRNYLINEIVTGGYPEVANLPYELRHDWFSSYITTIINRDIKELSHVEGLNKFPDLLRLLAGRTGGLLNFAEISRILGLPSSTLKRYLALLEAVFLVVYLPAWFINYEKRIVKAPKIYLNDTGLLCYLYRINDQRLKSDHVIFGSIFENLIVMELMKQASWSNERVNLYHFRTHIGLEIDLIIENSAGQIVAIEIKSKSSLSARDIKPIQSLQKDIGNRFKRGIILYTGKQVIPFGKDMVAVPVSNLWIL